MRQSILPNNILKTAEETFDKKQTADNRIERDNRFLKDGSKDGAKSEGSGISSLKQRLKHN